MCVCGIKVLIVALDVCVVCSMECVGYDSGRIYRVCVELTDEGGGMLGGFCVREGGARGVNNLPLLPHLTPCTHILICC